MIRPPHRRGFLAGLGAGAAVGAVGSNAAARPDVDAALAALLDQLAEPAPADQAARRRDRLAAFDPTGLCASSRLDRDIILAGLDREARLAAGGYAARLSLLLGADRDPAALRSAAVAEIETLHAAADALLAGAGLARGGVGERLRALAADPGQLYPDTDAGRNEAVTAMNAWLDRARGWLAPLFPDPPVGVGQVAVHRMSPADEAGGRGGYRQAAVASSAQPGGYWVDLHDIRHRPRWSLASAVHHETLPGHLLQLAFEAGAPVHPLRRRYAAGYAEGWAVYAEQLADDQGAYAGRPLDRLGYIYWRLFRLGRVVADIAIHTEGWDDDRASTFLADTQGFAVPYATFAAEVARMRERPGAVAAEGAAAMTIADLKRRAQRVRGADFDIRRFHGALLVNGPLSVDAMEAATGLGA